MTQVNKTKRRFLDLKVNEISLVDLPANQKEFAVVKRLQEEEMPDEIKNQASADDVEKKAEAEETKDENKAVEEAMGKVVSMVEGLVQKKEAEEKDEEKEEVKEEVKEEAEEKAEEKTEKAEEKTEKAESKNRSIFKQQLVENGIEGDALESALKKFDDQMNDDNEKVEKREEAVEDKETQILEALESSILKAKRFTPGRMKTLKSVVDTLQSLMKELTPIQMNEEANQPEASFPTGIDTSVSKAIEKMAGVFEEKMTEMAETNKSLNDRVEAIEKVRNPSASIEEEGDTDKEAKVEKSFWGDVL